MPLKVFYTSINGFLLHLFSRTSIHVIFRLTHEKRKMFQRTVRYMLKIIVRDTTKSLLKQLRARPFHALRNYARVISTH